MLVSIHKAPFILVMLVLLSVPLNSQVIKEDKIDIFVITPFRYEQLSLDNFYIKGSISAFDIQENHRRTKDSIYAGYYLMPPLADTISVDNIDKEKVDITLKKYLSSWFYDSDIIKCLENYALNKLNRREYYFIVNVDSTKMVISGWYDNLMHLIIFTNFDTKEGFIKKSKEFFNLGDLDIKNVVYVPSDSSESPGDFMYKYIESDKNFVIHGYPHLNSSEVGDNYDFMILDLTIYTREQDNDE